MKHFLFLFLLISSSILVAQTKVSGTIKDASGEPLPFVNVIFKSSNEGTISNEEGRFYLESDSSYDAVVFSFIGFESNINGGTF